MKTRLTFALFLLPLTLSVFSAAFAQEVQWSRYFGGPGDDGAESMVVTDNGDLVIAGFYTGNSYKDVLLMKTDPGGNEIWSKTYNLNMNDWGKCLRKTNDGGFIIAGMTEVTPQIYDPFLVKTDSAGNIQWQKQYDYGFGDDDRGHSVWQTSDGGYILAGQTWLLHGPFGNYDIYLVKTDNLGNEQWKKIFFREDEGADVALSVQQLEDDGYIVGAFTQSSEWASYILRLDAQGDSVWTNIYPGEWQSECYEIQSTSDGGFIMTGTESNFVTDTDLLLMKLDAGGGVEWKKIYGTVNADQGESIQQLSDGYIVAGMSALDGSYSMYVVRTNNAGDSLWTRTVGGPGDDRAFTVVSPSPGSYVAGGWTWSFGQGLGDVYLINITESVVPVELTSFTVSAEGSKAVLKWTTATELNNSGFEIQKKSGSSDWISTGFVRGAGNSTQLHQYMYTAEGLSPAAYTFRLKQVDYDGGFSYSGTVQVEINPGPADYTLSQNYPNPFNPVTVINYSIAEDGFVHLDVYNALGQKAASLVNGQVKGGSHTVSFDASNLSSGVYYYRIETKGYTSVKKMILLR